jgi:phosphoribosylglycinamide formyltransferase-1
MKLAVFAYNFPHRKTQDFLLRLFLDGYSVELVIACNPAELDSPKSILRVKPRHVDVLHPKVICERLDIPYHVLAHNSREAADLLRKSNVEVGIIAGARILSTQIIQSVSKGIVNFHPGWIPEVRGLDALKWAIHDNLKIGITAHFIDERVDAGRIILRREIPTFVDDTFIDLSLRLEETQNTLLSEVMEVVGDKGADQFPLVPYRGRANSFMPKEFEGQLHSKLKRRLSNHRSTE